MIFLDYASATPLHPKAFSAMSEYFSTQFFNPSAPYLPAKAVRSTYEQAKNQIAHLIGAKGIDLIMTAGATESINLAFTVLKNYPSAHCLALATEHDSVLSMASQFNFDLIQVDPNGLIDLSSLRGLIQSNTVLISVALVNGELGTIQPLADISALVRQIRHQRLLAGNKTPLYLHSDASQALGLLDVNVSRLGVDLLTLNSGKVYGPKGVGALYVDRAVQLCPIVYGGGQERGLRSGTENVAGVIGFAAAATEAKKHLVSHRKQYSHLRQLFSQHCQPQKIRPLLLGHQKHQLVNFLPISFPGLDAERLIFMLEDQQIYVSTGAACAASKGKRSKTLAALGLTPEIINGSLRITFGAQNTDSDIILAAKTLARLVDQEASRIGL